jgi:hypothetical protein
VVLEGQQPNRSGTTSEKRLHQFSASPPTSPPSLSLSTLSDLSYTALPLSFNLYQPLSGSSSPSACLVVRLPIRRSTGRKSQRTEGEEDVESGVVVQDLREGAEEPFVEVVRTLDPEPRCVFVFPSLFFLLSIAEPPFTRLRCTENPSFPSPVSSSLVPSLRSKVFFVSTSTRCRTTSLLADWLPVRSILPSYSLQLARS